MTAFVGRLVALVGLGAWAVGAIVVASVQVARDVIAPSGRLVPVVVVVPLRTRSRAETATVSGLVTLTPGTLPVGITADPDEIWVHGLYGKDPAQLRDEVEDVQRRVLRALRGSDPGQEHR